MIKFKTRLSCMVVNLELLLPGKQRDVVRIDTIIWRTCWTARVRSDLEIQGLTKVDIRETVLRAKNHIDQAAIHSRFVNFARPPKVGRIRRSWSPEEPELNHPFSVGEWHTFRRGQSSLERQVKRGFAGRGSRKTPGAEKSSQHSEFHIIGWGE